MRRTEDQYRILFESNPSPMWVFDVHTLKFLAVNEAAIEHYGYSREEFLAMTIVDIQPPGEAARLKKTPPLKEPGFRKMNGWAHRKKDGTLIDVEIRSREVTFEGRAARLDLINDATERKEPEEDRIRNAELEAANKELEAFSYSVSHDLRAPLRAIDSFSGLLLEEHGGHLDQTGRQYLEFIRGASLRMGQLIQDLLELSRITTGELRRVEVDLSDLARAIAAELRRSDSGRQADFSVAPGLTASADPRLIRIALENLLRNAWKFTGKTASPRIEFGALTRDGEKEPVYFLRDNGAGFDMEYAQKLFGVFQRLHSDTEFAGTGVGLATVQRIIVRHGGKVWAEGAENRGATFYFTLPGA